MELVRLRPEQTDQFCPGRCYQAHVRLSLTGGASAAPDRRVLRCLPPRLGGYQTMARTRIICGRWAFVASGPISKSVSQRKEPRHSKTGPIAAEIIAQLSIRGVSGFGDEAAVEPAAWEPPESPTNGR